MSKITGYFFQQINPILQLQYCPALKSALTVGTRIKFVSKVSFFVQCIKNQIITLQNLNIQTCFSQFLWVFSLKCWFKGQMMSKIHLSLPNAYKLMCFDRNINENRDVKFLGCDYLLVQRCMKLILSWVMSIASKHFHMQWSAIKILKIKLFSELDIRHNFHIEKLLWN